MSALHAAPVTVVTPTGPLDLPPLVRVVAELPGLPGHHEWTLAPLDGTGLLFTLRSEPDGARPARLFVVEPHAFFPDYAPTVPVEARAALGLADDQTAVLLVVVHPADDDRAHPSANLLAPVVVHPADGRAVQVVLDDDLPLRAPLA